MFGRNATGTKLSFEQVVMLAFAALFVVFGVLSSVFPQKQDLRSVDVPANQFVVNDGLGEVVCYDNADDGVFCLDHIESSSVLSKQREVTP